jgi:hypothetical protein
MTVVNKIATFLIERFGSKEAALKELTKGHIWGWNSDIFKDQKIQFLAGENITRNDSFNHQGWWCNDETGWSIILKNGRISVAWKNYLEETEDLFKMLGGYSGIVVSIEVNPEYGKTVTEKHKSLYNAPYGIYGTHYDVDVEVDSPEWVLALWHQVNLSVSGMTLKEFQLPIYKWLWKLIPDNLGSNRKDCHSAFAWSNSFCFVKEKNFITLNGDKVYTLDGKYIKSNMEKEVANATPKAPKGYPEMTTVDESYGTTVCLGGTIASMENIFGATVQVSCDLEEIRKKYVTRESVNWRKEIVYKGWPSDLAKPACVSVYYCTYNRNDDETTYYWYFPGKSKWVPLGARKTAHLLLSMGATLPEELAQYTATYYPKQGNGWKVVN